MLRYQISWKSVQGGAELLRENQRTDMTRLVATFSNLAKAPKKTREKAWYTELQAVRYRPPGLKSVIFLPNPLYSTPIPSCYELVLSGNHD